MSGKWQKFRKVLAPKISELSPRDPGVFVHLTSLLVLQVFCEPRVVDIVTLVTVARRFIVKCKGKKFALDQAMKAQRGCRGVVLPFLLPRSGRGWVVNATSLLLYPRGNPSTHCIGAGWASGPIWTDAQNLVPTGIRSPNRSARSVVAIPTTLSRPARVMVHPWSVGSVNYEVKISYSKPRRGLRPRTATLWRRYADRLEYSVAVLAVKIIW